MNTLFLLKTIQCVTVGALFVEVLIVFTSWKNRIHSYLFFACIASLISNIGYLFELGAKSEETYLVATKLSYFGRVWIVFAFFLFASKICGILIPRILTVLLVLMHIGIYLSILTIGISDSYYKDYQYVPDPEFPKFYHSNGYVHDLFMLMNAVMIILVLGWIIKAFRKEKSRRAKARFFMLIMAFGVQSFFFVLQLTRIIPISEYYDLTMPGTLIGTLFMLIGMLKFDLLGTREIARDFAIDRISEGIIAVDHEGRIQYFNEPAAAIYPELKAFYSLGPLRQSQKEDGKKAESPEIKAPEKHYTPYDIISFIRDAVKKGESLQVNGHIYTPEENDLLYQGESYGRLYALVDDTEHYEYMEELKKQKDIADSANKAKSNFLASMSHEIRTPINAVLGMDEMILRESGEKSIRSYAADIMSAGKTLLSLINDILDLSKVEEGKMEIIPVQYDLSSLMNDLMNMIRERAEKKGLELIFTADPHVPRFLTGDEIRIRQCVMNLLTNAVKYTEKGTVAFHVSFEKKDQDHILLGFTVSDTGIGMKKEDMENLFSPYKRIEEKRNRSIEGTGLGMSITRQLLQLMGSELKVESEYGKGSVFSFMVEQPVTKWEELGEDPIRLDRGSADAYEYHELFHAPDARILVVDDTEMNLTVVKSLLKRTGIGIDTALSGKEALKLTSEKRYDMIFIDHMMPDMDGIETLKHLRESGMNRDVPAAALTANAVSGAREMYLNAGFDAFLSKPIDGAALEKLLQSTLPKEKLLKPEEDMRTFGDENPEPSMEEPEAELPEALIALKTIDEQAGISYCGSLEGYLSVLSVFHQTAPAKADEIQDLLESGDIKNYTIKVHALKSSARVIGAKELSELAKDLEAAGKREDRDFIEENTKRLLEMYRELDDQLSLLDGTDESLPMISEEALSEAYQTMVEIASGMDYGLMEGLLKELRQYRFLEEDQKRIARIEAMLTELDWDGMIQAAKEGMGS